MAVVIETTLGDFTIDLYTEERPQTCKNFLKLCKIKYYNFCLFHSVQPNFLAQTGDPTGSGTGGESIFGVVYGDTARYYEAEKLPKLKHTKPGLISMVNCGNNLLGSQFFLTLGSELQSLDEHCIFAEITEGLDILLKLNETICDTQHRPYKDIRITHTVILEDPFEDPADLVVPSASPEPSELTLKNGRIAADEEIDETAGMTTAEVEEMKQAREAQARATILEIVGDLPDANLAPPENVLFVCKLNPVTTDDDLEIIFSRFGKVKSCEVIRDHETGDSLQYAFVEFEDRRACEEAYFKMDNVLIDDRRIHVDFSQSVAKFRWKGKGRGVEYLDKDSNEKHQRSEESQSNTKREVHKDSKENHRDSRDRNHKRREDDRHRRREEKDWRASDRRKYEDRKVDDRKRSEGSKKWEGNHRETDRRRDHDKERQSHDHRSRSGVSSRRESGRREKETLRRDSHYKDDRGREKSSGSSSRNEINENKDKIQRNHQFKSHENGVEERTTNSKTSVAVNKDMYKKEEVVNSASSTLESNLRIPDTLIKTEVEGNSTNDSKQKGTQLPLHESVPPKEPSVVSDKKTKRKRSSSESKRRKKRKVSTSSNSSSPASDSSNSSSSSDSESSDYKRKHKHKTTVAKKYYHRGKLVKVVKKQKDSSETESSSDSSSDSDRKKKKHKGKKKHHTKKIVKIIEKRKKRVDSSDDSDSDSSSSDESEDEKSKKRKKKKVSEKRKKKKKNNVKKSKKSKNDASSDSEES